MATKINDMTIQLNAHLDIFFNFIRLLMKSDFWTGSRYSKYKKCANSSVYLFMFKVIQRRCIHNGNLSFKIGSFSVLITRQIGAKTSVSPQECRLCIIGW